MDSKNYLSVWCRPCSKAFSSKDLLKVHNAQVHLWNAVQITFYDCSICCDRFLDKEKVIQHILQTHAQINNAPSSGPTPSEDQSIAPVSQALDGIPRAHWSAHGKPQAESMARSATNLKVSPAPSREESPAVPDDETVDQGPLKQSAYHYNCLRCNQLFDSEQEVLNHIKTAHLTEKCGQCSDAFSEKSELMDHIAKEHPESASESNFPCYACDDTFANDIALLEHLESAHSANSSITEYCKRCNETFSSATALKEHVKTAHSVEKCTICDLSFTVRADLKKHMQIAHTQKASKECPLCGKAFSDVEALRHHILNGHQLSSALSKCPDCSAEFANDVLLNEHILSSHRTSQCPICVSSFQSQVELKDHLQSSHCDPFEGNRLRGAVVKDRSPRKSRAVREELFESAHGTASETALEAANSENEPPEDDQENSNVASEYSAFSPARSDEEAAPSSSPKRRRVESSGPDGSGRGQRWKQCEECGSFFRSAHGLAVHVGKMHS